VPAADIPGSTIILISVDGLITLCTASFSIPKCLDSIHSLAKALLTDSVRKFLLYEIGLMGSNHVFMVGLLMLLPTVSIILFQIILSSSMH